MLEDILRKINSLWIDGTLDDEQKNELLNLARKTAKTENSVNITAKLAELENRILRLEQGEKTEIPTEEYPEFISGKWYYGGDKIIFKGKKYNCISPDGQVCVWSPEAYPDYWEEIN